MIPCIDNSRYIVTSIITISSGLKRIDGYCSDILTFQYYISDVLSEVLTRPHRYPKHNLPFVIIEVTALNHSYLKKVIQYVIVTSNTSNMTTRIEGIEVNRIVIVNIYCAQDRATY